MRTYTRNGRSYLDLGVINGTRVRLSASKYFKLVQRTSILEQQVKRPIRLEPAVEEYLQRCTYGRENRYGKPKSKSQAETDARVLRHLTRDLENKLVHNVSNSELRAFLALRGAEVNKHVGRVPSVATINRETAVLTSFFSFMVREEHCVKSPAVGLKQRK